MKEAEEDMKRKTHIEPEGQRKKTTSILDWVTHWVQVYLRN